MRKVIATSVLALGALTTCLQPAQAGPPSGMLLGVYAFPNWRGLYVVDTIPGYAAEGRLFRGDVLKRVTADGIHIHPTRTLGQLEWAKDRIGPYRPAALEVFRPGVGLIYFWVEFRPVGGAPVARSLATNGIPNQSGNRRKMQVRLFTEKEKPGARQLFHGRGSVERPVEPPRNDRWDRDRQPRIPQAPRQTRHNANDAASLFGR